MLRVMIESPYAGDVSSNVAYARQALRHSLDQGEAPFASHLIYPQVLDDSDPRERALGLQICYEWMYSADLVAFYTDLGWTSGMIKALKVARLLTRRVEARSLFRKSVELLHAPY